MQPVFRFACLPLLFVLGTITNLVEISISGIVLAYLASLMEYNVQFCQDHKLVVIPLVCLVSFIMLAVPGYFTVRFMSGLAKRNRFGGAVVLAVAGAIVCLSLSAYCFFTWHNQPVFWSVIMLALISNAIGQALSVISIKRATT